MRNLILSVLSGVLLTTQVYAKQQEPSFSSPSVSSSTASHSHSSPVQDDTPVKTKSFTRSFNLDKNDKLNLANQRGSITIKTWDKNEVKVDAEIRAYAKTDNDAQKMLDEVSINATKNGDLVTYKTELESRDNNWGSSIKNGKTIWRKEVKIDYIVYMPANIALTASTQYGNILVNDFYGPTSFKIQYGNLTAGNLTNTNNYISIQYGKGDIKDMGGATIKLQYGNGINIGTVSNNLDVNAQYTAVNIRAVKGMSTIKHQYGSGTTIGVVYGNVDANAQYCDVKIGSLNGNLICKTQYGKVIVDEINAGTDVDIYAPYSKVNLGFAKNYNGNFDVKASYGDFKYGANISMKRNGDEEKGYNTTKYHSGQIGKGGSGKVNISIQYETVTFK